MGKLIGQISWSKGYLKDVKILAMKKRMTRSSQRPLSTCYFESSKMPLNFVEKGNDTILPVFQKEKIYRNDSFMGSFFIL